MRVDGRESGYAKLGSSFFDAAGRVQANEAPAAVARDMGVYASRIFYYSSPVSGVAAADCATALPMKGEETCDVEFEIRS